MPPLVFSQASTAAVLRLITAQVLTLRLYSNHHPLVVTDVFADFTAVVGAGYAPIVLNSVQWTITPGSPSVALYSAYQTFTFTDTPAIPTVYGYYVTNAVNLVVYAEQLFASGVPFQASAGQRIRIRPRFGADNLIGIPSLVG